MPNISFFRRRVPKIQPVKDDDLARKKNPKFGALHKKRAVAFRHLELPGRIYPCWKALEFLFPTVYVRGPQLHASGNSERKTSGLCLIWGNKLRESKNPDYLGNLNFQRKMCESIFCLEFTKSILLRIYTQNLRNLFAQNLRYLLCLESHLGYLVCCYL